MNTSSSPLKLHPLLDEPALAARKARFDRSRRLTGFLIGLAMGLVYMTVAEGINRFDLPGIPLYHQPPGLPWNILLSGLGFGLVALATSWSDNAVTGVLAGSLIGAIVFDGIAILNTLSDKISITLLASLLFLIILPVTAMAAIVILVFRWALSRHQAVWQDKGSPLLLAAIPLVLVLVAAYLGYTNRYPADGQQVLRSMHSLIQSGLSAPDETHLPDALTGSSVENFKANAQAAYTLQWSKDPTNRYAIPRPANTGGKESIGIARFSNGWMLICLYPSPDSGPECVSRQPQN